VRKRFLRLQVSYFAFFVNLLMSQVAWAQDPYAHWKAAVNWDGITPWENYIIRSPRHMGPNALPVPINRYPRVGESWEIESSFDMHRASGDNTNNLFHYIRVPMAANRVALALTYRSVEWYETSAAVRDYRRARDASGRGKSEGDVWITSEFQLVRQEVNPRWPDLALHVTVKTTAGKNFDNARHTNSPGYIFDLHAGRQIRLPGRIFHQVDVYGNAGLFVWQQGINSQNDAFNYGLRTDFHFAKWILSPAFGGYTGWINNGDRPVVGRLQLGRELGDFSCFAGYQYAFRDLTTHMFRVGLQYKFRWSKWPV